MEFFKRKVAVILNSKNDIGTSLIESLCKAGIKVIGLCACEEDLKLVKDKLNHLHYSMTEHVILKIIDAMKLEELENMFRTIEAIDVFINISDNDHDCSVVEGSLNDFKKVIDSKISDVVAVIRTVTSFMIEKQNQGHIITISYGTGQNETNISAVAAAAISSVNEILRCELRYLNADIKTTHIEIKSNRSKSQAVFKHNEIKGIAEMVRRILDTSNNLQVHKLWLEVKDDKVKKYP